MSPCPPLAHDIERANLVTAKLTPSFDPNYNSERTTCHSLLPAVDVSNRLLSRRQHLCRDLDALLFRQLIERRFDGF